MHYLFGVLLVCFSLCSQATTPDPVTFNVSSAETKFIVTLQANPTTGYQWQIQHYDRSLLVLTATHYLKPKTNLLGAPGQIQFSFALKDGVTRPTCTVIKFVYKRPWETEIGSQKIATINFQP